MERYIRYDFSDFEKIMFNFKNDQSSSRLRAIRDELNKFFKDSVCKEVIFTKNYDKMFFGMCVMPVLDGDTAIEIITGNDKRRISSYYIEIDSKILELDLSARELVAILLHEVGHLVNDSRPIEEVRDALNIYLGKNNEHLVITDSIHYRDLLAYALKDSLRKVTSLFFKEDEEIIADEFAVSCGYGPDLESAYHKIVKKSGTINKDVKNKLLVMQWILRIYKDIKIRRIGAIKTLNRAKTLSGSALEKREITTISRAINQIDDDALIQESTNFLMRKTNEIYKNFKYKGMRSLEDDLYEYNLRVKNIDDQEDALMVLRQINLRLAMIDDYTMTEKLSDSERDRWDKLRVKYQIVRDELSKKKVYDGKYYGLFVSTPVIRDRYSLD